MMKDPVRNLVALRLLAGPAVPGKAGIRIQETNQAGVFPQADVVRAHVEPADARLAVERAVRVVRIAGGDLNTAMGPQNSRIGLPLVRSRPGFLPFPGCSQPCVA